MMHYTFILISVVQPPALC